MSSPVAPGRSTSGLPISHYDNALTAPSTPARRIQQVDRSKVDPRLVKAAEGMETMFLDYLMKTMRQTIPKNEMDLESPATEIYRSMLDSETAQIAARAGGVGLADQIIAYMLPESYSVDQGSRLNPQQSTGGTDARRTE